MTISPTVRDVSSISWDGGPVRTTKPISFAVTVEIGNGEQPGCDLFYMSVCNPTFLSEAAELSEWEWRDQMLVLATLSFENIRIAVERKLQTEAPFSSWPDFAKKMCPFMRWEFSGLTYPPL